MPEQVFKLPDDFVNGKPEDVTVFFYETKKSSEKNKVNFKHNLLCFLLHGHKEVYSGQDTLAFNNAELLLLRAGHTLMTEKLAGDKPFKTILLFFSDNFLMEFLSANPPKQQTAKPASEILLFPKDDYILNFERSLLLLQEKSNSRLIKTKLEEILLYLFEKDPVKAGGFMQSALSGNKNSRFMQVVNNRDNFNLTTRELAFLCSMSVSSFKRKFEEVFETTPKRYFIEQKMKRAVTLLQQNKRSSEIYFELGYENLPAFSNEFKKHFGVSPKSYALQNMSL